MDVPPAMTSTAGDGGGGDRLLAHCLSMLGIVPSGPGVISPALQLSAGNLENVLGCHGAEREGHKRRKDRPGKQVTSVS